MSTKYSLFTLVLSCVGMFILFVLGIGIWAEHHNNNRNFGESAQPLTEQQLESYTYLKQHGK